MWAGTPRDEDTEMKPQFKPGYHTREIEKGVFGEPSKIVEEFFEFEDAMRQNNILMALQELSDMIGAIEGFANKYNMSLNDLIKMKEATRRAFESGNRV